MSSFAKFPKKGIELEYGTSGFRTKAEHLDHALFRMGLLSCLRSRAKSSSAIGLMITASHNPEPDNGVKAIDPHGELLEQTWEPLATKLVNSEDSKLESVLSEIISFANIDVKKPAVVFLGMDTRPSSSRLVDAAIAGIETCNGKALNQGIVTTPLLHYLVHAYNTVTDPELPLQESYYIKLASAFKALHNGPKTKYKPEICFDGSNGVGAIAMKSLIPLLNNTLDVEMHNYDTSTKGKLNHLCGADYVKSQHKPPQGFTIKPNVRIVSVDGDADRVIYSYVDSNEKFHLLDGDRIAILVAAYIMELLKDSGLDLRLGLVQTAYSNGNSTKYISEVLNVPVACVETGVKHLHHKALEFDIGVYFEANGHGTVVFSNNARNLITQGASDERLNASKRCAINKLKQLTEVINSTVGDAISDMLLVESILYAKDWSIQDWENIYVDLPSCMVKVNVPDKSAIETIDASRKCTKPIGLQEAINKIVAKYPSSRSFVRPSGTEDVVRVYAEAATQSDANSLAQEVVEAVKKFA